MTEKTRTRKKGKPGPASGTPDTGTSLYLPEEKTLRTAFQTFQRYNAEKIRFLYELLPERKKVVFDLVPLLLHLEGNGLLPCEDACRLSPRGIHGYEISQQTLASFAKAFPSLTPPQEEARGRLDLGRPIRSVSLIGSMGSIAQGPKSDFDYWICIDPAGDTQAARCFEEKLRAIEVWAWDYGGAEVHGFRLPLDDIQADRFGEVNAERSGTAQGKLLKEEFYRSMTLIAGQTPCWWAMPPRIGDDEYQRYLKVIQRSEVINRHDLVDMGNVHDIAPGEFYGAAIWQINKVIGSPFKSILKLALLEEYLFAAGHEDLLCHELKERLLAREEAAALLDPYMLMFERASGFLERQDRREDLDLLRRALYLKTGVKIQLSDYRRTDHPRQKQVMVNYVRRWGWNHRRVEELNNYEQWTFQAVRDFNDEVNRYLMKTYRQISAVQKSREEKVDPNISARDLTVLGRKLYVLYARRPNKADLLLSVVDEPPALRGVTFQLRLNEDGLKQWEAYRGMHSREAVGEGEAASAQLKRSYFLTEILLWLVHNRIYGPATAVNLNQGLDNLSHHVTLPAVEDLLKALENFFPPLRLQELDEATLLKSPKVTRLFLAINVEAPDWSTEVLDSSICYANSWGELFFRGFHSDRGVHQARRFVREHYAYDLLGVRSNFAVYLPKRTAAHLMTERLNKFFGFKVR